MAPNSPPAPDQQPPVLRKRRWMLYGCGGFIALLLVIIATVAITLWWIQRPIKPVVLSAREKSVVDDKLRQVSGDKGTSTSSQGSRLAPVAPPATPEDQRRYVPGGKVIKLTEREINGLLNSNTDLGNSVRLEFAKDAINAYVAVPIPKDFPIGGGKMFRARGRFRLSLGNGGEPYAVLEDVTVFGISLPKAWLGGLKGENLLGQAAGQKNGRPVLSGIKSLRVEPAALVLELED